MDLRNWDPTTLWPRHPLPPIEVDLQRGTLNGAAVGDPLERLASLGRAELAFPLYSDDRRLVIGGTWHYAVVGLSVTAVGGRLESWDLDFEPPPEHPRTIRRGPDAVGLNRDSHEADLTACLGPITWRYVSEAGITLFVEEPAAEWMVELSPQGLLRSLARQVPVLTTAEGRATYGLPPAGATGGPG